MLTAKELWINHNRMCDEYPTCEGCPACLNTEYEYNGMLCDDLKNVDKFIEVVEQWVKDNPIITNRMKFKEVFGIDYPDRTFNACAGYTKNCRHIGTKLMCNFCPWWDEEYKEVK